MGHPRIVLIALAILAAGALAACGDDDEETTVTETVAEETTGSETGATETGAPEDTETLPADARIGPSFFSTPSGNIACHLSAKAVRCDIAKKEWKPTPPEEPCELDYGNGIQLDATHAEFTCAGDTTLGAPDVLGYGEAAQRGSLRCESETDGVTCFGTIHGQGFFISRQSYRIF